MSKCFLELQQEEVSPNIQYRDNRRIVRIYGTARGIHGAGYIGNKVKDEIERLGAPTSTTAFDLLTISLAVTAADTFFKREKFSDNDWSRQFDITIPLVEPKTWQIVQKKLESTLRFLTGDSWSFHFKSNGPQKPNPLKSRKKMRGNLQSSDCVCLYSGGLDSWLGVKSLLKNGATPLLVSHAYPKDRQHQDEIYPNFKRELQRFIANANPMQCGGGNDTTMRSRSFNFLAMGAVAAEALSSARNISTPIQLHIPENGLIALNAPLTRRRIGSLSTRTAHPHYLNSLQEIFNKVGINVEIVNRFKHQTKGAMLKDADLSEAEKRVAMRTVSCGKWKRSGQQCGRCVPCLIRRAAFHAGGIEDQTQYRYQIREVFLDQIPRNKGKKDDLMSVIKALDYTDANGLLKRAQTSGPLPLERNDLNGWLRVHAEGLQELSAYLRESGIPI